MATSKNIRYVPAIDHLRAYAALLVLLFHMSFRHSNPWPRAGNPFTAAIYEGHTGVALFLVLSGFIFTYGSAGRAIDYKTFIWNRVLRIYPLMIALIMIGVSAFGDHLNVTQVIETLLPVQNIRGDVPTTYLGMYNGVFWTISVECQFYLIFPFLYQQLLRRGIGGLLPLLAFIWLARWSTVLLGANPQIVSYYTILGRLDQFLIGMMAATVALRLTFDSRLLRWALPVGIVGLLTALYLFNQAGGFVTGASWRLLWPPVEAALWALIILGYLTIFQGRHGRVSKVIAGVGAVSYSMYLLHATIITIMAGYGFVFQIPGWVFLSDFFSGALCVYPVVLLISTLSYHAIEKPFLGLRRKYFEPSSNAPPAPVAVSTATREDTEEKIPGVKWLMTGLAVFGAVMLTAAYLSNFAQSYWKAAAAARAIHQSVESAITAADASHPSTCKVLLVQSDDELLAADVGRQLTQAGDSFVVSGQRWKTSFGADHNWQSLSAKALKNGLSPWYVLPDGTVRRGVPADAPVFPLRQKAVLTLTPPTLDLSAAGSTAEIDFATHGNGEDFVIGGWSTMDPGGTWTVESWAALAFQPQVVKGTNVEVSVEALPALSPAYKVNRQRVRLYFNGTFIGPEQQLTAAGTVQFVIPAAAWNAAAAKAQPQASLAIEMPDAVAPATLDPNGSDDRRKLGLFVCKMRLRVAP